MAPPLPSDEWTVIDQHKHDTALYVVALGGPCTTWRDDAVLRIPKPRRAATGAYGRDARSVLSDNIPCPPPEASWCLAVLLCEGDDLRHLVAWARRMPPRALQRIRFYAHPKADADAILTPWHHAFGPLTDLLRPRTRLQFTRQILQQLNDQVYADHAPTRPPGLPP